MFKEEHKEYNTHFHMYVSTFHEIPINVLLDTHLIAPTISSLCHFTHGHKNAHIYTIIDN